MIIANLATYPPRLNFLRRVVESLSPQLDRLNVVLNEYDHIPQFLSDYDNVVPIMPDHDTKDAGKFFPDCTGADYVFLVDDDVLYPDDFVRLSLERMEILPPGRYLGGYHCSIYRRPQLWPASMKTAKKMARFYLTPRYIAGYREFIHFGHTADQATYVDQTATNAAILRAADVPPYAFMKTSQKFVDVRLARWCFEQGIARVSFPRKANWLRPCRAEGVVFDENIHSDFTYVHHKHVADEIWLYAFKDPRVGRELKSSRSLEKRGA